MLSVFAISLAGRYSARMVLLPTKPHCPVSTAIYDAVAAAAARAGRNDHRDHLGASLIGHDCTRYAWLTFRWCSRWIPDGRMQRLLETGDRTEARLIDELRMAGMVVRDRDETGAHQIQLSDAATGGHFGGSPDGEISGVPTAPKTTHILEIKTAKAALWRKAVKHGVKEAKLQHYSQMQTYMRLAKLKRALYLVVNKDTDEIYAERVHYDVEHAEMLAARALDVIGATSAPPRVSSSPTWWACKLCEAFPLCHEQAVPPPHCRNCVHATAELDGDARWSCGFREDGEILPEPCGAHLFLPDLVPFAEVVDSDPDAGVIVYAVADGSRFAAGPDRMSSFRGLPCHSSHAIYESGSNVETAAAAP